MCSEAERVLVRPVGSEYSFSSSFLGFFAVPGGMISVEVVCWYGSMEWALKWAKHLTADLVETAV